MEDGARTLIHVYNNYQFMVEKVDCTRGNDFSLDDGNYL